MELLAPAGNKEKLKVALNYGADAVYIGGDVFNLRNQNNNFSISDLKESVEYAHNMNKKVYFTLNAYLHEYDVEKLIDYLQEIKDIPLDAFIIADLGMLSLVKENIPNANFHVSTQANITNSYALNIWKSLGASRVVLAREVSLDEIQMIKEKTNLEVETFIHGAVCMSYSGRCLLSNYLNKRDANKGDCSQVCRWQFKSYYIEEQTRPGEYMQIEEHDEYSTILSSKDLQMAEYLHLMKMAQIDSLKIEGRMKSVYYVANVVRVYRKLLDLLEEVGVENYEEALKNEDIRNYINELSTISRRESDTGFYTTGKHQEPEITPTLKSYLKGRRLLGMVEALDGQYGKVRVYNTISLNTELVYIGNSFLNMKDSNYELFIKSDTLDFTKVNSIRNVDSDVAYIKSDNHNFNIYDIITIEENMENLSE